MGATNLGEALRRITQGAAMIRSKGEAGQAMVGINVEDVAAPHRLAGRGWYFLPKR